MSKYSDKELKPLNRAALTELLNKESISFSDKLSNAELRSILLKVEDTLPETPEVIDVPEVPVEDATDDSNISNLIRMRKEQAKYGIKSEGPTITDVIFQRKAGNGVVQGQSIFQIIAQRRAGK